MDWTRHAVVVLSSSFLFPELSTLDPGVPPQPPPPTPSPTQRVSVLISLPRSRILPELTDMTTLGNLWFLGGRGGQACAAMWYWLSNPLGRLERRMSGARRAHLEVVCLQGLFSSTDRRTVDNHCPWEQIDVVIITPCWYCGYSTLWNSCLPSYMLMYDSNCDSWWNVCRETQVCLAQL